MLRAFAEKYLVKLIGVVPENSGRDTLGQQFELMHEHVVQIISEAPAPILQKARDAEERLSFWSNRNKIGYSFSDINATRHLWHRIAYLLAQPIPLIETVRLWKFARRGNERRLLIRNLRGFGLRLILTSLPIVLVIGSWLLWSRSDRYQIKMVLANARFAQSSIGTNHGPGEPPPRDLAALRLAEAIGYVGTVSDALPAFKELSGKYRDELLEAFIRGLCKSNRADEALAVWSEIRDTSNHLRAASEITDTLAESGRGELANLGNNIVDTLRLPC